MSVVTQNVSNYIRKKGINISKMARVTGFPYMALYDSLMNTERQRDLRDDEFLAICFFLEVDPRIFSEKGDEIIEAKN